ncbi:hypothetical protein [Prochlorococcus marinus]|uniref:hypothetical protein n=1 Tax=Prochlorococcus marinus TaxID=1219 RepID=UPI0022B48C1F|nr:hypothetical protein [Prochlorococcus marinus]
MIIFLLIDMSSNLEAQEKTISNKNSLINKFCIATLKSKLEIENKQDINEISDYTCECFFKEYNSGNSLKSSRAYCRNKASEKYNL